MSEPSTSEPRRLGDFEIVREIGRGGMGVVYEARQVSLKRRVALKVLSGQLGLTSQAVVRFRREAEAAAKLHHTNIVPIYATGEENGTHYYAMELIEGPSLHTVIKALRHGGTSVAPDDGTTTLPPWVMETIAGPALAHPKSEPEAPARQPAQADSLGHTGGAHFDTIARLIGEVADALDYAHQQGVIHRDIKPSNLLLSCVGSVSNRSAGGVDRLQTGPTSKPGKLSINDFGLARVLEQPGMTLTGDFLGTPRYMSPEQIAAGRAPLDQRTDIYSLGATLYELLTLQPPFPGERREQVIAQILHKDPTPPRRINRRLPVDLETICLKALEKDPDRRYQTAGQMAEDLRRYVNRFAISAKRSGPIARVIKWARRRPTVAALIAATIVLAGAAGFSVYQSQRSVRQARIADERARAAEGQRALDQAVAEVLSAHFDKAEAWLKKAEVLGIEPGRIRVLRGLAAVERGDNETAIHYLELASQRMPDSLAACSLLYRAYTASGRMREAEVLLGKLRRLTPALPEDYLWGAWAVEEWWAERSLEWLEHLAAEHPTPVVYYRLGRLRALLLMESYNLADIDEALVPLAAAVSQMPDYSWGHYYYHKANLVAADICRLAGDALGYERHLYDARKEAQRVLEEHGHWARAYTINANQAIYEGRWEDGVKLLRASAALPDSWAMDLFQLPTLLYRQGRFQEMLTEVRALPETMGSFRLWPSLYAFAAAEVEGPDAAEAVLGPKLERYRRQIWQERHATCYTIYCFLGRPADAVRISRTCLEQFGPPADAGDLGAFDRYLCGELSAETLLAAVSGRDPRLGAQFLVGLTCLAHGDRAGAIEHFTRVAQVRNWLFSNGGGGVGDHSAWAEPFLLRLRADPTWPPWIPVKEATQRRSDEATKESIPTTEPASAPSEGRP